MSEWERYRPAVSKAILLLLAGALWLGVGVMLLLLAVSWLAETTQASRSVFAMAGVVLGLLITRFGFVKIADRNLARILPVREKRCLFSFMPWRSYLTVLVMIALGSILRHSVIPKQYLAILYTGIGLALILSSLRYIRAFLREATRSI